MSNKLSVLNILLRYKYKVGPEADDHLAQLKVQFFKQMAMGCYSEEAM